MNQSLRRGEYFWVDIARDGIVLYELPCHPLATPMPLTDADAYQMAQAYFSEWLQKVVDAIEIAEFCIDRDKRNDAAFTLHQATERAYICFLLVQTLYFPRSHNIKFLRSLAEDSEPRLIEAWPRERRIDRRRFQLLECAYVEARYSAAYEIGIEELNAIWHRPALCAASSSRSRLNVSKPYEPQPKRSCRYDVKWAGGGRSAFSSAHAIGGHSARSASL